MTIRFSNRFSRATVVTVALLGLTPTLVFGAITGSSSLPKMEAHENDDDAGIFSIRAHPYGLSYADWSARFWEWEFSLPINAHPLFDTADCSAGQSGQVWFLGGTFSTTPGPPGVTIGKADRSCRIPEGKAIFFPIVNAECSGITGDHDVDPPNETNLRHCAESFAHLINKGTLSATIDDDQLNPPRLSRYLFTSPLFLFGPLPNNNIFQSFGLTAPAGSTWPAVSDGVHLMLHPLSPGRHKVKFYGEIDFSDGSKFIQDITYHLIVAP